MSRTSPVTRLPVTFFYPGKLSDIRPMSIRQEKFGKLIQKELADIFMQQRSSWFGNAFITVSAVTVSPDLGHAKVMLSFLQSENKDTTMEMVEAQNKSIRHELAQRIRKQVRVIPELIFMIDNSLDYVFKMEKLFEEIKRKDTGNS